ncbi:MAG: hypothetical protein NT027_07965 [Proteobacteria bacterium]|nr:hypothetical protein [Pseudomonadota bacterium]
MKRIFLTSALVLSGLSNAVTPSAALLGDLRHSWVQHGLRATYRGLDLAINGVGFFALSDDSKNMWMTRHGKFDRDPEGFIVYRGTSLKLLSAEGEFINLNEPVRNEAHSAAKTFRIDLDGKVSFVYDDGTQNIVNQIGIALTKTLDLKSKNKGHLFLADRNDTFIGAPQFETRGSIYQSSLEELDEEAYFLLEDNDELSNTETNLNPDIEITAQITSRGLNHKIESKRVRKLYSGNHWWDLSSDDSLFWNGKFNIVDGNVHVDTLINPNNYECQPSKISMIIPLNQQSTMSTSSPAISNLVGMCQFDVIISVKAIAPPKPIDVTPSLME